MCVVYDWASSNNSFFYSNGFGYVCFSSNVSVYKSNLYIDPEMNMVGPPLMCLTRVFPCPAIVRLTFTSLTFINYARMLLAGFSEHLL